MNIGDLKDLLGQVAESGLEDGHDLFDHPCSVAIRALDQCFEDINKLRSASKILPKKRNKKIRMLVDLPYDPSW